MRTLLAEEKDYNAFASTYKVKAFTAQEYDKNSDLKKAFESFIRSQNQNIDVSNLSDIEIEYIFFIEGQCDGSITEWDAIELDTTLLLFELTMPIKEIACRAYAETYTQGFVVTTDRNGITVEDDSIQKKVNEWHKIRKKVDRIKPFVESFFPRWKKASQKEKRVHKVSIEKLINDLEILGTDTKNLEMVSHFLSNYKDLNKINKFKEDILLEMNLPLIDDRKVAKKIVNFSKL